MSQPVRYFYLLLSLLVGQALFAQNSVPEKVRVIPGEEYRAGWLHRFFFGSNWRDLWATQIAVDILDLDSFAGGLKPVKRGGGFQTKSLRFRGADGTEYKFRSINKDPRKVLPQEFQETFVGDIVQDFISTSNPLSAIVAAPLLSAVGILHAPPIIVQLPDDERLGEFRSDFGGVFGTLEENPESTTDDETGFAGADNIAGTYKLFNKLLEDHDEQVDARAFLKARLMDVFLGDWDRHVDQWRWAGYKSGGKRIWKPIPRDRDQAFCRYEGVIPSIVEESISQIEGCEEDYPKIEDLTWSGRHLDRKFLSSIDRRTWDSIAAFVHFHITENIIKESVKKLPAAMYAIEGAELENILLSRREQFMDISHEYYLFLARYVDVRASDKDDFAEIIRRGDASVAVSLYKRDKHTGTKKGGPYFHRVFENEHTTDIRIHLFDGDDKAVVTGEVDESILVRVIGGEGKDELADRSKVNGYFLGITPISDAENKTLFYDDGKKTVVACGAGACYDDTKYAEPDNDTLRFEPPIRDWGHDFRFAPWYGITPDDGVFLGGGEILYEHDFRASPYGWRQQLRGGYASTPNTFRFDYTGDFTSVISGAHLSIYAIASGLEVINFFGFGNTSAMNSGLSDDGYYRVEQKQLIASTAISFSLFPHSVIDLGARWKYVRTELDDSTLLHATRPNGIGEISFVQAHGAFTFDSRDNTVFPYTGTYFSAFAMHSPGLLKYDRAFTKAGAELRGYTTFDALTQTTLALRITGEKIWGTYPFFEAAFLGGDHSLRGFDKQRFAGDASLSVHAELRAYLSKIRLLLPFRMGMLFFVDAGRVFLPSEESRQVHAAYGAGLWFSVLGRENTLSISVAHSEEKTGVYVMGGFMF